MKSIIFNQHQVNHALKNEEGMFRVVCKVQPNTSAQQLMFIVCSSERKLKGQNYWAELDKEKLNIKNRTDYFKTPYQLGETIFVKEKFKRRIEGIYYAEDEVDFRKEYLRHSPYQSPIHMKQEHSRLFLRIKSVKVERLADISEEDCWKEGITTDSDYADYAVRQAVKDNKAEVGAKDYFREYWNSTHKKPEEKWEADPFCFVYEYEVKK